jgi:hypothetical protein
MLSGDHYHAGRLAEAVGYGLLACGYWPPIALRIVGLSKGP